MSEEHWLDVGSEDETGEIVFGDVGASTVKEWAKTNTADEGRDAMWNTYS